MSRSLPFHSNSQHSPDKAAMHLHLALLLALCFTGRFLAAPITWESSTVMDESEFQEYAENAHSLISKILQDIPATHQAWIHAESLSLDQDDSSKLAYMQQTLNLPTAPALPRPDSENYTRKACLSSMAEGIMLHQVVLEVVSKLVHDKSGKVDGLGFDIRDLLVQIRKMQNLIGPTITTATPPTNGSQLEANLATRLKEDEYLSQVAAHLALFQLRHFARDVTLSLRSITVSDSQDINA